MDGYQPMPRLKRKELDEVNYDFSDFSDFSLTSPARKMRRLDAELLPVIEEPEILVDFKQPKVEQNFGNHARRGLVIEELPDMPENTERALVLFKPKDSPLFSSPSNYSFSVSPRLISRFKNKLLWSNEAHTRKASDYEGEEQDTADNGSRAVVPWVPLQIPLPTKSEAFPQTDLPDMMEVEESDGARMEIEDSDDGYNQGWGLNVNEGVHQWLQQHCIIPQPPQSSSTPVVWYQ